MHQPDIASALAHLHALAEDLIQLHTLRLYRSDTHGETVGDLLDLRAQHAMLATAIALLEGCPQRPVQPLPGLAVTALGLPLRSVADPRPSA